MAKFKFRFDTILKFRRSQEDEALRGLAVAQQAHQREVAQKNKLMADLQAALLRREELGQESTDILAFRIEHDFITGTKQRMIQADHAIMRAARGVEKALRNYLGVRRKTRIMEVLYESDFLAHKKMLSKQEQKEQDDLTIMRARFREGAFR